MQPKPSRYLTYAATSLGWAVASLLGLQGFPAQAQFSAPLPTAEELSDSPPEEAPTARPSDVPDGQPDALSPAAPLRPLPPILAPTTITPTAAPLFENVTLSPSSPDVTVRGISGGPQLAALVSGRQETSTGACVGYVDSDADHRMVLTNVFDYLSLQVESPEDTTLVVRGPGGSWCSDDLNGRNPGVIGAWSPGAYEIWVGSYRPGDYYPYVIRISGQPEETGG
ncbi:MAG: hypothetical protein WBA10_20095 [Elainellaceae cyanobacterium]